MLGNASHTRRGMTRDRRGLTLAELMISLVLLAMLAGGAASLSQAGRLASEQSRNWDAQAQTGRTALERIRWRVNAAFGSNHFPAAVVFPTSHGTGVVPDTLVVWIPADDALPQTPQGLPMTSELLFYFPDPGDPTRLIESRINDFSTEAPVLSNVTAWQTLLAAAKADDATTDWVELSDALRVVMVAPAQFRAAIHFHMNYSPSDDEFAAYAASTSAWESLAWPLGRVSENDGYRRATCNIELQNQLPYSRTPFYVIGAATASFQVER